ncbi:hypothetical protein BV133_1569 [Blastochloris viridis]|uniref:Uncharacterized protein n=1 Tax=Blastochloris viridis TaxID=1079 RepID=A0A182D346_BLAVI|nr:hypothetical protein BV133_1569 [Blastochloris viridis]
MAEPSSYPARRRLSRRGGFAAQSPSGARPGTTRLRLSSRTRAAGPRSGTVGRKGPFSNTIPALGGRLGRDDEVKSRSGAHILDRAHQ